MVRLMVVNPAKDYGGGRGDWGRMAKSCTKLIPNDSEAAGESIISGICIIRLMQWSSSKIVFAPVA